jgi:hypothetical protein
MSKNSRGGKSTKGQNSRTPLHLMALTTSVLFLLSFALSAGGIAQNQAPPQTRELTPAQKAKLENAKAMSVNIRSVGRILKAQGVEFEPGLLFTENGRKKLRPKLLAYPEMYLSKTHSGLSGVVMADTLVLPEKVKIEHDTVIISKHVVFTGRSPIIKGSHSLHLFALNSMRAANGKGTVITIDTSGVGRKEWLESQRQQAMQTAKRQKISTAHAVSFVQYSGVFGSDGNMGAIGSNGSHGFNGPAGVAGSCSTEKNGTSGGAGTPATAGGPGGNGGDGKDGQNGKSSTFIVPTIDAGSFSILARGGDGGNGGPGGWGGTGGSGGNGGKGGDGASCNCSAGGLGNGGSGGAAGAGGAAGNGGNGGKGGNGANGANMIIEYPFGYDTTQVTVYVEGGTGGSGGIAGSAAAAGSAGTPGLGGRGGSVFGCDPAQDGMAGSGAIGGTGGGGGNAGNPGRHGDHGSVSWNPTIGPELTGGDGEISRYEPGATYETCTEWFWVEFHCEFYNNILKPRDKRFLASHASTFGLIASGWECVETGRTYIGCF